MITKITGNLVELSQEWAAVIAAEPFEYEVLIPEFTRRQLQQDLGKPVSLHTIYVFDGNPQGKITPKLIGFLTKAEREFFDMFCSVDGVGTKKALRAMVKPVSEIAMAIEEKDEKFLASLPGIGAAMAERIVAKLRRKVQKFTLFIPREVAGDLSIATDVISETFEALLALGHTESDARRLIDTACAAKKKFKDSAELIQTIYLNNR